MEFPMRADGGRESIDGSGPSGGLHGTFERLRLWTRILSRLKPEGPRMRVGLLASALLDASFFATARARAISPKSYVAGVVSSACPAARFRVRAGTDDLYNVMPRREGDVEDAILRHLRPGDNFVDVGASVGYYSVVAAAIVGPHGRVFAIEPIPETYDLLRGNIALNALANVTHVAKACWTRREIVTLTVPWGDYGLASASTPRQGRKVRVEAVPLDDLTSGLPSVQVLKVDAEGAELEVLEGAMKTLAKTRFLVVEVTQDRARVEALLRGHSFSMARSRDYPPYLFASRS